MIVCQTRQELEVALKPEGKLRPLIGFVPTMGALHEGHLSLVRQAKRECEMVCVSIFVNPIQFNNPKDLATYPRNLDADLKLLKSVRCDVVFAPSEAEMYPTKPEEHYDFGALETVMEGAFRPGHFNGVATVVKRLFDIVKPTAAYFGRKDYQQLCIIQEMVRREKMGIEIVACPIVRESDGLAMSSRNQRLSECNRRIAPQLYKILRDARDLIEVFNPYDLTSFVIEQLNKIPSCKVEYYSIVDAETLEAVKEWEETPHRIACAAVWFGDVRLIDNIRM